jgi:hypothetical protein
MDHETPVVYDGEDAFLGTDTADLEILGSENALISDPLHCGAARGADCCIFITAADDDFHCERFSSFRFGLQSKKGRMVAQREPVEAYPTCQKFKPI